MDWTINLNDQTLAGAVKIDNHLLYWMLAPEFQPH